MNDKLKRIERLRVRILPEAAAEQGIPASKSIARLKLDDDMTGYSEAKFYGYVSLWFDDKLRLYGQHSPLNEHRQLTKHSIEIMNPERWIEWSKGMQVRIAEKQADEMSLPQAYRITALNREVGYDGDYTQFAADFGGYLRIRFTDCLVAIGCTYKGLSGDLDPKHIQFVSS